MAELINEQEQVDLLKYLWKQYSGWVMAGILVILLAMLGWRFLENRQQKINQAAATSYQQLLGYVEQNNTPELQAAANQLMTDYPSSIYGGLAGLLLAGDQMQHSQLATAAQTLYWVIKHSNDRPTITVAKIRLARVLLAQHQPQQALEVLQGVEDSFLSDMVRGDSDVALEQYANAQTSYQQALSGLSPNDPWYQVIQMKMASLPK